MATRRGRVLGYVAAVVVGLGIGAVLGMVALAEGMCATWGGTCTAAQEARIERLWTGALLAPFAVMGLYALVDFAVFSRRGGPGD